MTGGCSAGVGSTITLPTPYSSVADDLSGFVSFLDFPPCLINAHVAPMTSAMGTESLIEATPIVLGTSAITESVSRAVETLPPSTPTATLQSNNRTHTVMVTISVAPSMVLSSSSMMASQTSASPVVETATTSSPTIAPQSNGRHNTVMVAVSVVFSVIGAIAILIGGLLIRRRRRKLRHAQADVNKPSGSDSKQTDIYQGKPELDAEQRRHEMEAERERCELDGQSSRQELTAERLDDKHGRGSEPQELRGLEPSSELAVGHEVPIRLNV